MTFGYANWVLTIDEHIAALTLNRAEALNSITPETLRELRAITTEVRTNRDIWAVIVQGAGEHFSVGVDVRAIGTMIGQESAVYRSNLRDLQDCLDQFEALEKPTIASIRGHCIGGGLILALCCDFRIADETARFCLPEVRRGIPVVMGTQRVTAIAGKAATKTMVLLAEPFDAQQAFAYGLLHQVVPGGTLDAAVQTLANKFRTLPPRTVNAAKRIIDQGAEMSLRESQELEIELQEELLHTTDFAEAVAAFFEKRAPRFTGT